MVAHREDLAKAARPRVFEEILRLMRGAASHRSMWLLWESGGLAVLMPELAAFLDDAESTGSAFWSRLGAVDRLTRERGKPLDDIVLLSALLREPLLEATAGARDVSRASGDFLQGIIDDIAMPRRIADGVQKIHMVIARSKGPKLERALQSPMGKLVQDVIALG
jgi:poly(A) polymerase